jgi:hypothetical protein
LDWKKKTFRINVIWYNKTMARPKGIPMSEEAKDLIRQFQKGRTRSPETRARMSVAAKLRSEEHYANSRSPEARAKASAKMKGRKPWHSLRPTTEAFRESRRLINLGRPKSIETRLKMAEARRGEKSHLWKGGLSKEHYRERQNAMQTVEYRLWKESVFNQAGNICALEDETCSGPLQAHHIQSWTEFPELRYEVSNGQCLCKDHHQRTDNFAGRALALTKAA